MSFLPPRFRTVLIVSSAVGLSLGACREERLQLRSPSLGWPASVSAPYAVMPPPYQGPAPIGQLVSYDDGYAWAERSYALDDQFYGVEPAYGFDYGGVQPYVWETADDWSMYAEPYQDDYRFYYYEPGGQYPYFVRDADYGYGYDDVGRLVVIYDLLGRVMPISFLRERDVVAGDYYRRAYALRTASRNTPRITVVNNIWRVEQPRIRRSQTVWIDAARSEQDWVRYRTRTNERELRALRDDRRIERRRDRDPVLTRVSRTEPAPEIRKAREPRKLVRAVERRDEPRVRREEVVRTKAEAPRERKEQRVQAAKARPEPAAKATVKARDDRQARVEPRREQKAPKVERQAPKREQAKERMRREPAQVRVAEARQERQKAERAKVREAKAEVRQPRQERVRAEPRREQAKAQRAESPRERQRVERVKAPRQAEAKARPVRAEAAKPSPAKARVAREERGQKRDRAREG